MTITDDTTPNAGANMGLKGLHLSTTPTPAIPLPAPIAFLHKVRGPGQGWYGSAANVQEFALDLDAFVREELPRINNAIEAKNSTVEELMTRMRILVRTLQPDVPRLLATADREISTRILRRLGFIAASVERHAQAIGASPGDGLQAISGFTELLCAWSDIAGIAPMLDYQGYWIENRIAPLTFTGDAQEVVFNDLVNDTVDVVAEAMLPLNELRTGGRTFDDIKTAAEVNLQALKLVALYGRYRDLGRKTEAGAMVFSPAFFMRMRQYLLPFPVDGILREGPNATYTPSQARVDIALGLVDPEYLATLDARLMKMTAAHRDLVSSEIAMSSIADGLVAILGLPPTWPALEPMEIRSRAERHGAGLVDTMTALKHLAHAQIQLSNVHFGRIVTHLVKPSAALSKSEADAMPVKPTGGVGGNDVAHTRAIVDMRKTHPVFTVLLGAF